MSGGKQDQTATLRRATKAGCMITRRGSHIMVTTPNGGRVVASSTPSDVNASRNLRKDLLRVGVTV